MRALIKLAAAAIIAATVFGSSSQEIKFTRQKIKIGKTELMVELAITPEQQRQGLMYRRNLKSGEGMLFVYKREQFLSFWMKNTFIPLSIGFINEKGVLIDIQDMQPVKSEMENNPPTYQSKAPAQYALEVPQGWFKKAGVSIGEKMSGLAGHP